MLSSKSAKQGGWWQVEDVLVNQEQGWQPFHSTTHPPLPGPLPHLEWLWKCALHKWAFRGLAVLAALLSLAVVVAEATLSPLLPDLSIPSLLLQASASTSLLATQLLCFALLLYPCLCAYYSLFKLVPSSCAFTFVSRLQVCGMMDLPGRH